MIIVAKAWEYLSPQNVAQSTGIGVPVKPPVDGDGVVY